MQRNGGPCVAVIKPTWLVQAVYGLTPSHLQQQGIKAVLCDLDNTLIAWNNPDGTKQLHDWLNEMQQAGLIVMVVSNNNHDRVKRALAKLELPFVSRALKPLPVGINRAIKQLGLKRSEVVMVGDQLLTDVLAGNVARIKTILVQPLVETDAWNTRITRFFERGAFWLLGGKSRLTYREDIND
ncbi:YqeG family HAD IIIA-type phosphatase [Lacticaseibacillus manihotivorans]|uniref:YqeG family HAD IIIA-type phosphatase n=1 Tax=Lacticaseibacillus manihotivorans TaxID=88233 RepID=A0A5P8JRA1_9LACO|nr:YqeG family HAD IIIA-type phosphatase [Lacticaseibacillus manihotivorans]